MFVVDTLCECSCRTPARVRVGGTGCRSGYPTSEELMGTQLQDRKLKPETQLAVIHILVSTFQHYHSLQQ